MSGKAQMSVRTKKILLTTGIIFGTIFLFAASFFLSLYFIIHPIKITTPDNGQISAENQELKVLVKTYEAEIERLKVAVDKGKSDINPPAPDVDIPTVTTPGEDDKPSSGDKKPSSGDETDGDKNSTDDDEDFSPETVVTPEGGYEPEPEEDITIIDISE